MSGNAGSEATDDRNEKWKESEIAALSAKGVTFQKCAHLPQNDQGVWTTPDGAKIAWFTDPSGNILSLTQPAVRGTAAL